MPTSRRQMLFSAVAFGLGATTAADAATTGPDAAKPWMDDRLTAHLQRVLELSDADWAVVSPRIEAVLRSLYQRDRFSRTKVPKPSKDGRPRDASVGGGIVTVRTEQSRTPDAGTANADLTDRYFNLISLAAEPMPFTGEIKAALSQYRAARARSDAELARARASLRELMSLKQEAALVVMGILD